MVTMTSSSLICACIVLCLQSTYGARILLMPEDFGSHVNYFMVAGSFLRDAGHQVYVLTSIRNQKTAERFQIPGIFLDADFEENYDQLRQAFSYGSVANIVDTLTELALRQLEEYIGQDRIIQQLKALDFDLVIIDGAPPYRLEYIIPYKIGVKYMTMTSILEPWQARIPSLPSAEPAWPQVYFDKEPSFMDRMANLVKVSRMYLNLPSPVVADSLIEKYVPEKPQTTFKDLYLNSEMWIVNLENICLDRPRVYAPHFQYIGGLNNRPAKPLPKDLESFVKSADEGLILVTFGAAVEKLPMEILEKMMKAFAKIKQKVLMRFTGEANNVPQNVKFMKWLPQNDILGHNKTRLFITHAGNHGHLEALYHGVPMLSMPLVLDQRRNAIRSEHRGYGKALNPFDFNVDQLVSTIKHMMDNTTYRDNIKRCSAIYHDFPTPHETLLFYVNHVIKFGGSHLKPTYLRMPIWKLFMLDVLAFLVVSFVIFVALAYWCMRVVFRRCCSTTKKQKEE